MRFRRRVFENSLTAYVSDVSLDSTSFPFCALSISTYVCIPILVLGTVDSTIGSPAYLLLDGVLIEDMLRGAVGIIVHVLGSGVESLL